MVSKQCSNNPQENRKEETVEHTHTSKEKQKINEIMAD